MSGETRGSGLKYEIWGIVLVALGVLGVIGLTLPNRGAVGELLARGLALLFGEVAFLVPVLVIAIGALMVAGREKPRFTTRMTGIILAFFVLTTAMHLPYSAVQEFEIHRLTLGGGLAGAGVSWLLGKAFGWAGRLLVLATATVIAVLLMTGWSLVAFARKARERWRRLVGGIRQSLVEFMYAVREGEVAGTHVDTGEDVTPRLAEELPRAVKGEERPAPPARARPEPRPKIRVERRAEDGGETERVTYEQVTLDPYILYQLPPLSLLHRVVRLRNIQANRDISEKSRILEETLDNFGVKARVTDVSKGPAITRFELQPAPGVKVSKIVSLADDIALSLAASDVRIEAPIPGKAAVGIEVPNEEISPVYLREVLESPEFKSAPGKLTVGLGKDIAGRPIVASLDRMPHLLIAGATGSGKSVCINSVICSLLFRARPDEVKFLLVDPKVVELTHYDGIPHLIAPVVTDPRRASATLKWVLREMENRYEQFAMNGVRDITKYNALKAEQSGVPDRLALPFIVVIIDELADLMMVSAVEVEDSICRLAQMARAAGIHLVVATQRPSVDVITGLIKANIPSRIAFAVSSQVDSRTILDMNGAEKLLGKGDMLFHPVGASKPIRAQGAFISEREVEDLVSFVRRQAKPEFEQAVLALEAGDSEEEEGADDELFAAAVKVVVEHRQASASLLQRRLRVGYTRAARLIDMMEERGFVGKYEGSKPREVHLSAEEYARIFRGDK